MSRVLDLDKKEAEWLSEIGKRKAIVTQCDNTIDEAQARKQSAIEEIDKFNRWINTAREMSGLSLKDSEEAVTVIETKSEKLLRKFEDMKIPAAVEKVLSESSEGSLTATEITKRLQEGGFKTNSTDFRNVMQNRLFSLSKFGRLKVEKKEGENYYSLSPTGIGKLRVMYKERHIATVDKKIEN